MALGEQEMKPRVTLKWLLLFTAMPIILLGCRAQPTQTPTTPIIYSLPQLEYRLLANFYNVFWCDPDFYPVERPGQEEKNALGQFSAIRANEAEFTAILEYLSLSNKVEYTNEEKLLIYRQHKKLAEKDLL